MVFEKKVHVKKVNFFDLRRFVMSRSLIEKKSIIINFIENCKFDLTKNFLFWVWILSLISIIQDFLGFEVWLRSLISKKLIFLLLELIWQSENCPYDKLCTVVSILCSNEV